MTYKEERPLANVEAAIRKLLEIANGIEADHAGRLQVGAVNAQFLGADGSVPAQRLSNIDHAPKEKPARSLDRNAGGNLVNQRLLAPQFKFKPREE
jgi:hypothetical protein